MAKTMQLDFRKAPPSSGGGTDKVPPGNYELVITKVSDPNAKSRSGKPMLTFNYKIARGPEAGKRLRDNFLLPASAEDNNFGLQKLHACLLSCNLPVPADKKFSIDLEKLVGKRLLVSVADGVLPGQDGKPDRTVSQVDEYLMPRKVEADDDDESDDDEDEDEAPAAKPKAKAKAKKQPEPEPDEDDEEESEDDEDEEPEPAPKPKAKAKAKAEAPAEKPKAKKAKAPPPEEDDDDDEDDEDESDEDDDDSDDFPF